MVRSTSNFRPQWTLSLLSRGAACTFAAAVALGAPAIAIADDPLPPPASMIVSLPTLAPLVKKVLPAVVNVSVTMKAGVPDGDDEDQDQDQDDNGSGGSGGGGGGDNNDNDQGPSQNQDQSGPPQTFPNSPFDQFLRRFFDQQQGGHMQADPRVERMALGSGFIIDPKGYVVTNNHVVANADKVTVIFQDDTKYPAKVVGRDPKTDLALVKIDAPAPLPYVEWGDSNAMQVGDWVLAVGNPFGLGGTVSSGIISARGRDIHEGPYDDFLQIDASINRGNSGGPTFSLDGKVIGINTAIYSPNGGSVGIGFAIPSSLAKPVIEQLKEHGKVQRGWLGVQIQEVTPELAKSLGLPKPEGALVADVTDGGPAQAVGLKQGDVIVEYDHHPIAKVHDLPLAVAETPVGDKADVKIWRDGKPQSLQATIAAMPANLEQIASAAPPKAEPPKSAAVTALGLKLEPLTTDLRNELHIPKNVKGVVVTAVADKSPFADLGLAPGDVIQQLNQEPATTPKDVAAKLQEISKGGNGKNVLLLINRHGVNQFVALSLGSNGKG